MNNDASVKDKEQALPVIDVTLPPVWHLVRAIRERARAALVDFPAELRVATTITASELVENAIKYGNSVLGQATIRFSMSTSDGLVCIQVSNGSTDRARVEQLRTRIEEIKQSTDKEGLYLQRLEQLLAHPSDTGKLGLYRVALDGGFDLNCSYELHVVTVTATRKTL